MQLSKATLTKDLQFYWEEEAYSGVNKIADKVRDDMKLVFGVRPGIAFDTSKLPQMAVLYGTVDKSPILNTLSENGKIDLNPVRGKREVYLFQVVSNPVEGVKKALVIAGSDKRGTIYGLFHLSELIGVSPLVEFSCAIPAHINSFTLDDHLKFVSNEPSVRFRGFFINDEWPAFGNWCKKKYGGFNAEAYEHIFELLLRLKGNYLWPAMWSGRFQDDGPGLLNAELADEYGVVMGMSHHEPCLRQGEEYKYLRGKDSVYGDAWNFRTNEAGITKFWEDGLKRSGKFENVITVGMRGEADTAIMGKSFTLADNIELLRDVLRTQRRLIQENVNEDISKVPRMIALYKEVEEFFYGNKDTKGLMGCEELEDVILMLCDDNFGNLRTLPTQEMRKHKGGYGMYYHFDYHGWPVSYEWINTSFLPKIWEQMTQAYDFGVRDLWIVNVGDICTQELPLSYFLDLAYDFENWGTDGRNRTEEYTKLWIKKQFGEALSTEDEEDIFFILRGYTKIANQRRTEALHEGVYHPVNNRETEELLAQIEEILTKAENLYAKLPEEYQLAYMELVYYPAVGTLNVFRMWLYAGLNQYLAKFGAMEANNYIDKIKECVERDKELVESYHTIANGKWYGMGLSEHIGFTQWNEDECKNPVLMQVLPANKERIRLMIDGTEQYAEGSPWLNHQVEMNDFLDPRVTDGYFSLYSITDKKSNFSINCKAPWLECSTYEGTLNGSDSAKITVKVTINRLKLPKKKDAEDGYIDVELPAGRVTIKVLRPHPEHNIRNKGIGDLEKPKKMIFAGDKGYVCMEAEHFYLKESEVKRTSFEILEDYGKTLSAIKAFPSDRSFTPGEDAPYVEYRFMAEQEGQYTIQFYLQPSNAVTMENEIKFGYSLNDGEISIENTIPEGAKVGDHQMFWGEGVLNNIRIHSAKTDCIEGENILRVYAMSPGFVLERIVIAAENCEPAQSYLGPKETYYF